MKPPPTDDIDTGATASLLNELSLASEVQRGGRSLDIEHLLVAPILKRRYAKFLRSPHGLDWDLATRRAPRPRSGQQRPLLRDR